MINNQKYVILSLELHLFFSRIMKEHSIFLEAGFTPKDSKLASEADHYKTQFEKLLYCAISASNGVIISNVLNSGEIFTDYTFSTEQTTSKYTGIEINQNITIAELKLHSGTNPQVSPELINYVTMLNCNAIKLLDGLIKLKERILNGMLSCTLFTVNYPLLIEHILREANLYRSFVVDLENKINIESKDIKETELFWDQIMMEHALFIRGLLDPSEGELVNASNNFANEYKDLMEEAQNMTNITIDSLTNETLNQTIKFKDFKQAGTIGIDQCKIKSIILPLLADHVLREANHYVRILESYTNMY